MRPQEAQFELREEAEAFARSELDDHRLGPAAVSEWGRPARVALIWEGEDPYLPGGRNLRAIGRPGDLRSWEWFYGYTFFPEDEDADGLWHVDLAGCSDDHLHRLANPLWDHGGAW
jgi:hypothetical protein